MELTFASIIWPFLLVVGPLVLSTIVAQWDKVLLEKNTIHYVLRKIFRETVYLVQLIPLVLIGMYFPLVESKFAVSMLFVLAMTGIGQIFTIYFARFIIGKYDHSIKSKNYQWVFLLFFLIWIATNGVALFVLQMIFLMLGV